MANFNRRQFLQLGAAGIALGSSVPFLRNPIFRRALHAAECDLLPAKKMLVIWQRGGNDGLNTVIPYGDNSYNTVNRPTLFVDPLDAIDLNGFCALHPSLAKLHEVYLSGDLAIMHRVGYDGQSRSHFTSQHYWENGEPGSIENLTGMVNNLITEDPLLADHALPAASVSYQYQQLFQGPRVLSHIADLRSYTLGTDPDDLKLIGALPGLAGDGSGVLGIYSQPGNGQQQHPTASRTPRAADVPPPRLISSRQAAPRLRGPSLPSLRSPRNGSSRHRCVVVVRLSSDADYATPRARRRVASCRPRCR